MLPLQVTEIPVFADIKPGWLILHFHNKFYVMYPVRVTGTRCFGIGSRQPTFRSSHGLQNIKLTLNLTITQIVKTEEKTSKIK